MNPSNVEFHDLPRSLKEEILIPEPRYPAAQRVRAQMDGMKTKMKIDIIAGQQQTSNATLKMKQIFFFWKRLLP
jgi:hypothetical protein